MAAGQLVEPGTHLGAVLACVSQERLVGHDVENDKRGSAGERIATERASETANVDGVHDLRAARHGCERKASADRFTRDDQIRLDTFVVVDRPHLSRATDPRLHLVVDVQDAVRAAELLEAQRGSREASG